MTDMEFAAEYFQGEEREGFYVQPMMKRAWAVSLDILKEIDAICKRRHIKYYGWYGTLLGAVRHQGFIPWDDDLDLAFLREDYERFQYFARMELPEGWKVMEVGPTLIRVLNTEVIRLDQDFLDRYHGCPLVIGVDIFCLDHLPENTADKEVHLNLFWAVCNLYKHWELFTDDRQWVEKNRWDQLGEIEKLTGCRIDRQQPVKGQLYALADRIAAMYWDAQSDEVANIPWMYQRRHYRFSRSCFDRIIEVPFENTTIPIPEDYDLMCRLIYGDDYRTPIMRAAHDGFKDQIDILREHFKSQGRDLPEWFDMTLE